MSSPQAPSNGATMMLCARCAISVNAFEGSARDILRSGLGSCIFISILKTQTSCYESSTVCWIVVRVRVRVRRRKRSPIENTVLACLDAKDQNYYITTLKYIVIIIKIRLNASTQHNLLKRIRSFGRIFWSL